LIQHRLAAPAAVLAVYLISRAIFRGVFEVEFDASPLGWFWQYIDPPLLLSDPLRSLYYHHAQPPLFNLFLAAGLHASGDRPDLFYNAAYMAFGAGLHLALYGLLRRLDVGPWLAAVAAIGFALSPGSVLYEAWLYYSYPVAFLLLCCAIALHRLVAGGGRGRDAALFFSLLAVVGLTRSLFHISWMFFFLGLALWVLPRARKRVGAVALLPLLLVLSVHAKNAAEFGSFSTTSWFGMHLARLTTATLPPARLLELHRQGIISEVSLRAPFSTLDRYPPSLRAVPGDTPDHPVLRSETKTNGSRNLNHIAYVEISRRYTADALAIIRHDPLHYIRALSKSWLIFSMPPSAYWFLDQNRDRIGGYVRFWNAIVYGDFSSLGTPATQPDRMRRSYLRTRFSWTFALFATLSLAFALRESVQALRTRTHLANGATLLFMVLTVLFVGVVGNAVELRENNRYRFLVEPLVAVLLIHMANVVWNHIRSALR